MKVFSVINKLKQYAFTDASASKARAVRIKLAGKEMLPADTDITHRQGARYSFTVILPYVLTLSNLIKRALSGGDKDIWNKFQDVTVSEWREGVVTRTIDGVKTNKYIERDAVANHVEKMAEHVKLLGFNHYLREDIVKKLLNLLSYFA